MHPATDESAAYAFGRFVVPSLQPPHSHTTLSCSNIGLVWLIDEQTKRKNDRSLRTV